MPKLNESQLIFEAYQSINEINEDRYELRSTRDGYVIIDHSIRGPNNILARFDRDERNEAIARYNHYTKQMSPEEIRASFDKIRASFNESLSPTDLEMAASIWPKKHFKSEEEWLAYVHKWWSKLPSIVNTLNSVKKEASRGLAANKGEWEEVSDTEVSANKDVRQDIYDIIKVAYGPIGGHPDFPTVDRVPGDNNVNSVVDTDEPDDIDAAILSKRTSFGNKITTFASDGGAEAKRAAIAKTVDLLNTPGNYVEVSGKLMDILIARGAPTVDDEDTVRAILKGKEIMWHGDGVYTREIGGKPYTKKMLGKPRV